ncbi:alanine racemase, partial [Acinetobacter baumannii]
LDIARLDANLRLMRERADALGVALRPHMKTLKSADVARYAGAGAITVSTLKEADYFEDAGITDILYAVGIAPNKVRHAIDLRRSGVDLTVILDNE